MGTPHTTPGIHLPIFDGFPYLATRIVPALYHIIVLPVGLTAASAVVTARTQVLANRLPACLALAHDRAIYFGPNGDPSNSPYLPTGGYLVAEGLAPAVAFDNSSEGFRRRQARLAEMIEQGRRIGGRLLGDLTKGGHAANDEERVRLAGSLPDGTPRELARCSVCGDWKGECLDPSPQFVGMVMTVHCTCDNHNLCARCSVPLFTRRLNSNYYDPHDRIIRHVPGFCGLSHRCEQRLPER